MRGNDLVASRQTFGLHGRKDEGREGNLRTRGGLLYYGYDGLGSVTDLTDRTGDEAMQYRYDAFGGIFTGITSPYNTVGFTGKTCDPKAGLVQFYSRWYDPSVGRFTTQDSYLGDLLAPASQHRYVYALNNPTTKVDRWGYVVEDYDPSGPGTTGPGTTDPGTTEPVETWYGPYEETKSETISGSVTTYPADTLGNYIITFEVVTQYTEIDKTIATYKVGSISGRMNLDTERYPGTRHWTQLSKRIIKREATGADPDSELIPADNPTGKGGTTGSTPQPASMQSSVSK